MTVLNINNLTKKYGSLTAVDNLSLRVQAGEVYGLLGPNGSGKTTTLGIILGILSADSGSFQWFDGTAREQDNRKRIGTLLETPNFYPYMNAVQNLGIVAHIKKIQRPKYEEILQTVNLAHRKTTPFQAYSLGMKQRLALAAAMLGEPDVLVLDEPTNGLDPQGIAEVREIIQKIATQGKTIIFASHILDEVEKVCNQVAIIKNGRLLAAGTVGAIISGDKQIEIAATDLAALQRILQQHPDILTQNLVAQHLHLTVKPSVSAESLNALCFKNGITLSHLAVKKKSLEAEFLEITA